MNQGGYGLKLEQMRKELDELKGQKENFNTSLLRHLSEKPIAFNRSLALVANSALAGLFMSQLLYWWGKGREKDWIFKTIKNVEEETIMKRSEQDRAIRIWERLGVLTVEARGVPPKRHFQILDFR